MYIQKINNIGFGAVYREASLSDNQNADRIKANLESFMPKYNKSCVQVLEGMGYDIILTESLMSEDEICLSVARGEVEDKDFVYIEDDYIGKYNPDTMDEDSKIDIVEKTQKFDEIDKAQDDVSKKMSLIIGGLLLLALPLMGMHNCKGSAKAAKSIGKTELIENNGNAVKNFINYIG